MFLRNGMYLCFMQTSYQLRYTDDPYCSPHMVHRHQKRLYDSKATPKERGNSHLKGTGRLVVLL